MTPGARVAAAIAVLDEVLAGAAAEQALTRWARRSRFAGSGDRTAVRDHVFDALRNLRGYADRAGLAEDDADGRAVMLGAARAAGVDPDGIFTGEGHAPAPLTAEETARGPIGADPPNLPDWIMELLAAQSDPATARAQADLLSGRAPVTLRANVAVTSRDDLARELGEAGFDCRPNPLAPQALTVTGQARGLTATPAFAAGAFELQDAASQAVVAEIAARCELDGAARLLDFCAGGGGKTLALAAATGTEVDAHDAEPSRMRDLPKRAARAGTRVRVLTDTQQLAAGGYDLVLLDVPCSGSGAWRRAPDARWRLSPGRLDDLLSLQREILAAAAPCVAPGGCLAYVTCSILEAENAAQANRFAGEAGWRHVLSRSWPLSPQGDGFFLALFRRGA